MSNPSIANKLMSMVKGIFGQKEEAAEPSPRSASTERKAEAGAAESTTAAAANVTATATPTQAPAKDAAETTPAAEDSVKAVEEDTAEEPAARSGLVEPEDRAAVAEELAAAEATTQVADDSVMEGVRRQAAPAVEELAVPGYDDLTIASIRARLRKLTIDQVRDLRAYELAHGERQEFVKMYDNRIAKLQAEES